ncbi:TatD family hydrolase [Leeuwenhoekiella sp. NPDC079379]|uniref:TatD family hydrolase n=1 Tax=Leeuwenhoekiella sp. NPDC079379 TaxID=3364122 RepID=UPI0037C628F2
MFIDTHTHLYSESFDEDRDAMIARAQQKLITHFMLPAIDSTYTSKMWDLKKKYPDAMLVMAGLHPTHVKPESLDNELDHVAQQLASRTHCAIGEIGIDLYWDQSTKQIQQEAFAKQIQWAKEYDLPIVIHCRDAFDEVFEILKNENNDRLRGVFHCFTGTEEDALQAINFNLKLGIGGVATFKNGKIDQFLKKIDLKHIVLETDAPYLAPTPYRGKRNESSYLIEVAQKLSDIYNVSVTEIGEITTKNAKNIFNLD